MQGFHQRKVHGKHRTELKSNKKIYTENIIFEYTENLQKKFHLISRIDMKKNKAFTISTDPIK